MKVVQINVFTKRRRIIISDVDREDALKYQALRLKHIYLKDKQDKYIVTIEKD